MQSICLILDYDFGLIDRKQNDGEGDGEYTTVGGGGTRWCNANVFGGLVMSSLTWRQCKPPKPSQRLNKASNSVSSAHK